MPCGTVTAGSARGQGADAAWAAVFAAPRLQLHRAIALAATAASLHMSASGKEQGALRTKRDHNGGRTRAAHLSAALLAFLFALAALGSTHAHAAGAHADLKAVMTVTASHPHQAHAQHSADDQHDRKEGKDACCISAASCALCAPLPDAGLTFAATAHAAAMPRHSASRPHAPPTLFRPPQRVPAC